MTVTNFLVACSHDLIWRFYLHNFGFCFRRMDFFFSPKGGGIERLKRHDQHPPKIPINTIHPKFSNGSSPEAIQRQNLHTKPLEWPQCYWASVAPQCFVAAAAAAQKHHLPMGLSSPWRFPVPKPQGGPWGARLVRHVKHVTKLTSTTK